MDKEETPKKLYLQIKDDQGNTMPKWERTYHAERIYESDVEYVLTTPQQDKSLTEGDKPPNWYSKEEIYRMLLHDKYSEEIAGELSERWSKGLQSAFEKGYDKAYRLSQPPKGITPTISEGDIEQKFPLKHKPKNEAEELQNARMSGARKGAKWMKNKLSLPTTQAGVNCPKCHKRSECGCKSCKKRRPDRKYVQEFTEDGESMICPHCKKASHADLWMDSEFKEYDSKQESITKILVDCWEELKHVYSIKEDGKDAGLPMSILKRYGNKMHGALSKQEEGETE